MISSKNNHSKFKAYVKLTNKLSWFQWDKEVDLKSDLTDVFDIQFFISTPWKIPKGVVVATVSHS